MFELNKVRNKTNNLNKKISCLAMSTTAGGSHFESWYW